MLRIAAADDDYHNAHDIQVAIKLHAVGFAFVRDESAQFLRSATAKSPDVMPFRCAPERVVKRDHARRSRTRGSIVSPEKIRDESRPIGRDSASLSDSFARSSSRRSRSAKLRKWPPGHFDFSSSATFATFNLKRESNRTKFIFTLR